MDNMKFRRGICTFKSLLNTNSQIFLRKRRGDSCSRGQNAPFRPPTEFITGLTTRREKNLENVKNKYIYVKTKTSQHI